jgi:hypothetical protein
VVALESKEAIAPATEDPVAVSAKRSERMRFYRVRHRAYTVLLVFVVAAGLPVIGVPFLRHRLADRVQGLRTALAGNYSQSVIAQVGENQQPFPEEYEHPAPDPHYPILPPSFSQPRTYDVGQIYPAPVPRKARKMAVPSTSGDAVADQQPQPAAPSATDQAADAAPAADADPVYRRGKLEQEVYDVLVKSDPSVTALVQNGNSAVRFKSWDVAKRQEDTYWVRLTFTQKSDNSDIEAIWQVQLMSKQVTPLSSYAKSLPKS